MTDSKPMPTETLPEQVSVTPSPSRKQSVLDRVTRNLSGSENILREEAQGQAVFHFLSFCLYGATLAVLLFLSFVEVEIGDPVDVWPGEYRLENVTKISFNETDIASYLILWFQWIPATVLVLVLLVGTRFIKPISHQAATDAVEAEQQQSCVGHLVAFFTNVTYTRLELTHFLVASTVGLYPEIGQSQALGTSFLGFMSSLYFVGVAIFTYKVVDIVRRAVYMNHSIVERGVEKYLGGLVRRMILVLVFELVMLVYFYAYCFTEYPFVRFEDLGTVHTSSENFNQAYREEYVQFIPYNLLFLQLPISAFLVEFLQGAGRFTSKNLTLMRLSKRDVPLLLLFLFSWCTLAALFGMSHGSSQETVDTVEVFELVIYFSWPGLCGIILVEVLLRKITKWKTVKPESYDVFLTHDWGTDEKKRSNHARVAQVNKELKSYGLRTWFDEDRLVGNIQDQMAEGIERSEVVVVFLTKRYIDKVCMNTSEQNPCPNPNDNCKREFLHAVNTKTSARMIAVVMEERVKKPSQWGGVVGFNLGSELYINLSVDDGFEDKCEDLKNLINMKRGEMTGKSPAHGGEASPRPAEEDPLL